MISIITPAHKIIPWFNLRLDCVCTQDFDDWEWIILDNSEDGCVCRYVNEFFVSMQGTYYPECREKIKCIWEPFTGVSIHDARIGKLKNRCIELTSCKDDDFILLLDFDDFIYPGFLSNIDKVTKQYPDCEIMTGLLQESIGHNASGDFFIHDLAQKWHDSKNVYLAKLLYDNGFNSKEYFDVANDYINAKFDEYTLVEFPNILKFTDCTVSLLCKTITKLSDNGWSFFGSFHHPFVYKKGAFLNKLGGYNTKSSREDWSINHIIMWKLNNPVYINKPCYLQCGVFTDEYIRDTATGDVCDSRFNEANDKVIIAQMRDLYESIGCRQFIKPIFWDGE